MPDRSKLWFVLDMDEGVKGVFRSKAAAIEDRCPRDSHTVKVRRYGPGAYGVVWHYVGDPSDGDDFFLERGDAATIGKGGWEPAIAAWEAAGCPIEPYLDLDIQDEASEAEDAHVGSPG